MCWLYKGGLRATILLLDVSLDLNISHEHTCRSDTILSHYTSTLYLLRRVYLHTACGLHLSIADRLAFVSDQRHVIRRVAGYGLLLDSTRRSLLWQ